MLEFDYPTSVFAFLNDGNVTKIQRYQDEKSHNS